MHSLGAVVAVSMVGVAGGVRLGRVMMSLGFAKHRRLGPCINTNVFRWHNGMAQDPP